MTLLKILFFLIIMFGGLYYYVKYYGSKELEGLTTMNGELRCPNLLIQKDSKFYLYNTQIAKVPGVNPIEFDNLEEYVEFLEWQRGAGIRCPVLYVQNTYDAQGERVYKIRPSVTEPQGGLPPAPVTQHPPHQTQETPGPTITPDEHDPDCENDGLLFSPNPMCNNWGGAEYTESLVDSGYYAGNEVMIRIP